MKRLLLWLSVLAMCALWVGCRGADEAPPASPEPTEQAPERVPPLISLGDGPPALVPDFTLTAQTGEPLTLSDLRGGPVILTFLYTNCRTICPLYVGLIPSALALLGEDQARVSVVAVTVDPERDTVEQLARYTEEHGWPEHWYFVTGDPASLEAVWDSYRIVAHREELPEDMRVMGMQGYEVVHRAAVLVIDQDGYAVEALRNTEWTPEELAEILREMF